VCRQSVGCSCQMQGYRVHAY
ncbi:hypothetical protein D043_2598B, partial [Vibrio parahaemolyticus EKP-021]